MPYARIATLERPPGWFEGRMDFIAERVVPTLQQQPGFQGVSWLMDRARGKAVSITHWATEDDLRAGEAAMTSFHAGERQGGESGETVEWFEVITQAGFPGS